MSLNTILQPAPQGVDVAGLGGDRSPVILASLIEGEIIPRLLMAHRDGNVDPLIGSGEEFAITAGDVDEVSLLAITSEAHHLATHVASLMARGIGVEAVLVNLLAPAARGLGVKWENDEIDFITVTMGLWRMQEVVHELAARAPGASKNMGGDRRALFCVMPGEQHSFGTSIVDECFRRRGWTTLCVPSTTETQLLSLVKERWFEIIGLTVSCTHHTEELQRLIGALRKASRNPQAGIMVGGPFFVEHPHLAAEIGADATAKDARGAVDRAEQFVAEASVRPAINV